jgi:hypothetical protein
MGVAVERWFQGRNEHRAARDTARSSDFERAPEILKVAAGAAEAFRRIWDRTPRVIRYLIILMVATAANGLGLVDLPSDDFFWR